MNDKNKIAQNIWFYDLVHEISFRLSSRTPLGYLLTSCPGQDSFILKNYYELNLNNLTRHFNNNLHHIINYYYDFFLIIFRFEVKKTFLDQQKISKNISSSLNVYKKVCLQTKLFLYRVMLALNDISWSMQIWKKT